MDTKPKRRLLTKKRKKHALIIKQSSVVRTKSELEGIKNIMLSPLAQRILECRIGHNITAQEPWIFVKKEDILDNIAYHEHSSEFLAIKKEMENYPEDKILIGSYGHEQEVPEMFMVCTSPEAVKITLAAMVVKEAERRQQINESIWKECKSWHSLGSEIEIDATMSLSFRHFYQVHLTLETPWCVLKCKFKERPVEDCPEGYVELLSKEEHFDHVYRKRMHSNAQCAAIKADKVIQADFASMANRGTKMMFFDVQLVEHLTKTDALDEKYIFDLLQTNYYMDLYNDDYFFSSSQYVHINQLPVYVLSFQDVFTCWMKRVSDVSWNALKSGIIAAAYAEHPNSMILYKEIPYNTMATIYEDHLVLIWTYDDIVNPHLYLHYMREITTINFCTYNENIIVGGCQSGQIVVWDISGRLERCERSKVLTRKQMDHRRIVESHMKWMKPSPEVQHVYPVLISNIKNSHKSPISYIEWLPPDQHITRSGKFEKSKPKDVFMQFLSCSIEDGCINIWDIGVPKDVQIETKTAQSTRLAKVPDGLTKFVSPLKALKNSFRPVFKISFSNPVTNHPLLISKLLEKQANVNYKALNPETVGEIYERTYFKHIIEEEQKINEQRFLCATTMGEFYSIQWEHYNYDPGCRINKKSGFVTHTKTYHDGPIVVCMESLVIKDLILTVGGTVFAIWNGKNLETPVFWRKSANRYVGGSWLTSHPFKIYLIRYDTIKEIWDLMIDSKNALKIMKWNGRPTNGLFNDFKVNHAKKNTFIETNVAGEINVFVVADSCKTIKSEELEAVINYLHDMELRKVMLINWINSIKAKFTFEEAEEIEDEEIIASLQQQSSTKFSALVSEKKILVSKRRDTINTIRNKWQAKEAAYMKKMLLQKRNVNVQAIRNNICILDADQKQKEAKYEKVREKINNREKTMQSWKVILLSDPEFIAKHKITVNFPKDLCQYMKQRYIENYESIKEQAVDYIRENKYQFVYNWADCCSRAKKLYDPKILII